MFPFRSKSKKDPTVVSMEAVFASRSFQRHAASVVDLLESVVLMMLGDDMTTLAETLNFLGRRHVDYGVHPAHYISVETALLRTLAGALGDQWTEETRKGWAAVYKFIGKAMMSGAGSELEIVKDRRQKLEKHKMTTMRLKVISNSKGVSELARSGVSSRQCRWNQASPKGKGRATRRRNSDPPRLPSRQVAVWPSKKKSERRCTLPADQGRLLEGIPSIPIAVIFEGSSASYSDLDLDSITSDSDTSDAGDPPRVTVADRLHREDRRFSVEICACNSIGSPSNVTDSVPLMPKRSSEGSKKATATTATESSRPPDIIVIQGSSKKSNPNKDSAPKQPRRSIVECGGGDDDDDVDFLACKVEKPSIGLDGSCSTDETAASTMYEDESFRREYWREETVKVIIEC